MRKSSNIPNFARRLLDARPMMHIKGASRPVVDKNVQGHASRTRSQGLKRAFPVALLSALVASGFIAAMPAGPAYAYGTYFNNWPGNPVVNYALAGTIVGPNLQAWSPTPVPSLQSVINTAWNENRAAICNVIESHVGSLLKSYKDWTCSLPASGDLEGSLVGANELGLRYAINDIAIGVDWNVLDQGIDWANVNATSIDGSVAPSSSLYGSTPLSIGSSEVSLSDADVSSSNIAAKLFPGALTFVDNVIDNTVLPNVTSAIGVSSGLDSINGDFHAVANKIASYYLLRSDPYATELFSLNLGVDPEDVIFTFGRGGSPEPAPISCAYYPDDTQPGYTEVEAICSPSQPGGVTQLQLQEDNMGTWTDDPLDTSFEPGAPMGPENSWLASSPYRDWAPNDGPDSGYAPLMTDYPPIQWQSPGVESLTVAMRVCSTNEWGINCAPAVGVTQNQQQASSGSSGSGGGGGGGGEGSGPPTTIYQPPGTKRHCGEPGVYCAE